MTKETVQGPRHAREIQRVDEQRRVVDLAAAAGAHETPKLLLRGPSLLRGLLLQGAERLQLALGVDELFDGRSAEGADQLVLQVCDAYVEAERLHPCASEVRAEA